MKNTNPDNTALIERILMKHLANDAIDMLKINIEDLSREIATAMQADYGEAIIETENAVCTFGWERVAMPAKLITPACSEQKADCGEVEKHILEVAMGYFINGLVCLDRFPDNELDYKSNLEQAIELFHAGEKFLGDKLRDKCNEAMRSQASKKHAFGGARHITDGERKLLDWALESNSKQKHSPLPFEAATRSEIVYDDLELFTIFGQFHNVIGYAYKEADAQFITRACNGYYNTPTCSEQQIERVARAITRAKCTGPKEWLDVEEEYWRSNEHLAKAAIQAINQDSQGGGNA